eukprot:848952-Prymnesium_polylepis.1
MVQEVLFDLVKPFNDSRTLTLRMDGTSRSNATWEISASSVPSWLVVERLQSAAHIRYNFADPEGEKDIVNITAITSGLPEQIQRYEGKLRLTMFADVECVFLVDVLLKLASVDDAGHSVWGEVAAPEKEGGPQLACSKATCPSAVAEVSSEFRVPFTSCDVDGLPVAHAQPSSNDPRVFLASITRVGSDSVSPEWSPVARSM